MELAHVEDEVRPAAWASHTSVADVVVPPGDLAPVYLVAHVKITDGPPTDPFGDVEVSYAKDGTEFKQRLRNTLAPRNLREGSVALRWSAEIAWLVREAARVASDTTSAHPPGHTSPPSSAAVQVDRHPV